MTRILSICGDPGGASALAPVLQAIRATREWELESLAYATGTDVLARSGLPFERLTGGLPANALRERWDSLRPDVLLCASSVNTDNYELRFIRLAKEHGIPSLGVLDYWSNYAKRFSAAAPLDTLPNRIAVMDNHAVEEMVADGFPRSILSVTGQPAFDGLVEKRRLFTEERRSTIRDSFGVKPGEWFVTFLSQPLAKLARVPGAAFRDPGYDELSVLPRVIEDLECAARTAGRSGVLAVKRHPREDVSALPADAEFIRCRHANDVNVYELMMAADLIVGMSTVALVEACYLGCLVVSVQPDNNPPDVVASNRLGVSRAVYEWDGILPALSGMLFDDAERDRYRQRLAGFAVDGFAAHRVVAEIEKMLSEKSNV